MRRSSAAGRLAKVVLAVGLLALTGGPVRAEITWPVELRYTVSHLDYAEFDSPLRVGDYVYTAASWSEWTNRPLSPDGTCTVRDPRGPVYQGTGQCDRLVRASLHSRGLAPNPWLNGRSIAGYEAQGLQRAVADDPVGLIEVDGVPAVDLVVLTSQARMSCRELGYLACGGDERVRDYRMTVVVHRPSGIPLLNEERLGPVVLSRFAVTGMRATDAYVPPAAVP